VPGRQGHAAYPERADNPLHRLLPLLARLSDEPLDEGSVHFAPSSLQVTTVDTGNPAFNVIPGSASAQLNIRFNDHHTGRALADWLTARVRDAAPDASVEISIGAEPFLSTRGRLAAVLGTVIATSTGRAPAFDTGGGTSDARFFAGWTDVAEFGLVGQSMHAVDEHVPVADLAALASLYLDLMRAWHG
jgi:succinyl-diaminopimelate desuccinylase